MTPIEEIIIDFLNGGRLPDGVTAYAEEPTDKRPGSSLAFVLVSETGGGGRHIYTSKIAVQSYAPTKYRAAQLSEVVKAGMESLSEISEITDSVLDSSYYFPEENRRRHRYQVVFDVTHY